jgi:predicted SAM-dependent methyltransferase
MPQYLNLGCGDRYLKTWTNLDFKKTGKEVRAHNLLKGIPFPDCTFDAVYHSHVLEHFTKEDGIKFIGECFRILKSGGIIRVVVPDLEMICKEYLKNMERAANSEPGADADYDWIKLELYDQTVRNSSGGEMESYLRQPVIPNEDYVLARIGEEGRMLRNNYLNPSPEKARKRKLEELLLKIIFAVPFLKRYFIGRFRLRGQIHQWMYDRYSLGRLLVEAGFENTAITTAFSSNIPNWEKYQFLDVENDQVRKPDSLFLEAQKP